MQNFFLQFPVWLFTVLCFNTACDPLPPEPPEPPSTPESKLKVVWQTPIAPDTFDYGSRIPYLYKDQVIFHKIDFRIDNEGLVGVNRHTGEVLWEFMPDIYPGYSTSSSVGEKHLHINYWGDVYMFDLSASNASLRWVYRHDFYFAAMPRARILGDYYYHTHRNSLIHDTVDYLVRTPLTHPEWDTIFTLRWEDGFQANMEPPIAYVHPSGDTLLIFQNRQWNFQTNKGRIDLYAFNLTTRKVEWKVKNFDPMEVSSVYKHEVNNHKLYFMGHNTIFCFDAQTGARIWEYTFSPGDNLLVSSFVIGDNRLFIKPGNDGYFYALDANTGQLLYRVPDTGKGKFSAVYFEGIVYFTTDVRPRMYAIRAETGEVIWREHSPNYHSGPRKGAAYFAHGLELDPEKRLIYLSDWFYYMAIELAE